MRKRITLDEIGEQLINLQQDLDKLAGDTAKTLAKETAEERISAWEKNRLYIIVIVLGLFGISTLSDVQKKIADLIVNRIEPEIAEKVDNEIKAKTVLFATNSPYKEDYALLKSSVDSLKKQQIVLSRKVESLSITVGEIAKKLNIEKATKPITSSTVPIKPIPNRKPDSTNGMASTKGGWAFFGVENGSGGWAEYYFENISRTVQNGLQPKPQKGDILRARGLINIRQGYIVYTDAGWINTPSIGILRPNERIRVIDFKEVVNGYWWILFTPVK